MKRSKKRTKTNGNGDIKTLKEIAEIEDGPTKKVKLSIVSNGRDTYLDVRQYVESEKYSGPTKKGIWIDWDTLNTIVNGKLLEKAVEVMDEIG